MNGARALIDTLVSHGVDVVFANPGTSEMHFVAALDAVPEMRAVLTLFEGVATGAADGYARLSGRPAAVLLHLGPGLGNGLANLHNARRAGTPMVVVVGDHATYHKRFDAPLESDIESVARTVSGWVRRTTHPETLADDAVEAIRAAVGPPAQIATLVLPADVSWSEGASLSRRDLAVASPLDVEPVQNEQISSVATALQSPERTVLLIGGDATAGPALLAAGRIAEATDTVLLSETFPARLERGAGVARVEKLSYLVEAATAQLADAKHLILAGAREPVAFFAYPGRPSSFVPAGCQVHTLPTTSVAESLIALEDLVCGSDAAAPLTAANRPQVAAGPLTASGISQTLGALLPRQAVIVDEANTSGIELPAATAGSPPHDVLALTGGAIGYGLPAATGAAIAAPGRPILCLEADGSAMYTISALWTHARENLNITTVIYNNRAYDILRMELARVGAQLPDKAASPKARALLDIDNPALNFAKIATGMGVPARQVTTAEEFNDALDFALAQPGPLLIDAVIPPIIL
ncbi:acetolactate synthase large subunit [Mycobacterium sp. 134]|uniref:acetolactate synthase large subunit n=1 Tax=Mycobacterium sp. 134 TaxID=3400425 RepID=UPI003AAD9FF0